MCSGVGESIPIIRRFILFLILFFAFVPFTQAGALLPSGPSLESEVTDGGVAPDFRLPDPQGKTVTLSGLRGKVVLLTFWASWCPPCRQEMPSMNRLYSTLGGEEFEILGINIEGNPPAALRFVDNFELVFPVLLDAEKKVQQQYGVFNIPQSFLIDKSGKIVLKFVGLHDWMSDKNLQMVQTLIRKP